MADILRHPITVSVLTLVILWLSVYFGAYLTGKIEPVTEDERKDLDLIIGSSLTLLALIIGFSFSMAVGRYDERKLYEEQEANAIGTEYSRMNLLPAADAAKGRQLLTEYLNQRVLFYTVSDSQQLNAIGAETAKLEGQMLSTVQGAVHAGRVVEPHSRRRMASDVWTLDHLLRADRAWSSPKRTSPVYGFAPSAGDCILSDSRHRQPSFRRHSGGSRKPQQPGSITARAVASIFSATVASAFP